MQGSAQPQYSPTGGLALLRFGKKSPQGQEEKEASIFVSKNFRP